MHSVGIRGDKIWEALEWHRYGILAARAGRSIEDCPYTGKTARACWEQGWKDQTYHPESCKRVV